MLRKERSNPTWLELVAGIGASVVVYAVSTLVRACVVWLAASLILPAVAPTVTVGFMASVGVVLLNFALRTSTSEKSE
jgi:uncharacterized membrane protein YqgA involved in biofilm formation